MKIASLIHYCLFYLFTCIGLLQAEGFIAGTLIKTDSGYTKIEQLEVGDNIISPHHNHTTEQCSITDITYYAVDCCIKIGIGNEYIYAAADQKFYSYNQQKWVAAHELQSADLLMNCESQSICIVSIETIHKQCTMYALSVETNHTLCVSPYDIIAHNSPEVVLHIFSFIAPAIMQTVGAVCATLFGAHIAQKISKKHRHEIMDAANSSNANSGFGGGGDWQDPEDDKEKYPHGIYKESPAYRSKKCGRKSPSPKNGQKCLDNSLPGKGNSTQRISIEGDDFIVLKQTRSREFHGYRVTWDELHISLQQVLKDKQLVTKTGKIIKETVNKVFK